MLDPSNETALTLLCYGPACQGTQALPCFGHFSLRKCFHYRGDQYFVLIFIEMYQEIA